MEEEEEEQEEDEDGGGGGSEGGGRGVEKEEEVEALARLEFPDEREQEAAVAGAINFHRRVATRMESHLQLVCGNLLRSTWEGAALLSSIPANARTAARVFFRRLVDTAPAARTRFETCVAEDDTLMEELDAFRNQEPPTLLWKHGGRFKHLYKFLALRFLGNPDSVLDVERVHAIWKWVLQRRHSMKPKALNAWLKLCSYLDWNDELPPIETLEPYITRIRAGFEQAVAAVRANQEVAVQYRRDSVYWERLNLSVSDVALLKGKAVVRPNHENKFEDFWANHVRWTFKKDSFFSFPTLRDNLFLYVIEHKSAAGRDALPEEEALGRPLSVAWFEEEEELADGILVRRVDRSSKALKTQLSSIAEILHAAGQPFPALGANASARDMELAMEAMYRDVPRLRYEHSQEWSAADPWMFTLTGPLAAEEAYLLEVPLEEHNKMGLARLVEQETGADLRDAFKLTKETLLTTLADE